MNLYKEHRGEATAELTFTEDTCMRLASFSAKSHEIDRSSLCFTVKTRCSEGERETQQHTACRWRQPSASDSRLVYTDRRQDGIACVGKYSLTVLAMNS